MKRVLFLLFIIITTKNVCVGLPPDLVFYTDSGARVTDASIPNISYDSSSKTYYLFYNGEGSDSGAFVASSTDGLNFTKLGRQTSYAFDPRQVKLPDGNFRLYEFDSQAAIFKSRYSTDAVNFTLEDGSRYSLDSSDNGRAGIYDIFSIPDGRVIMLYLGDLLGLNNLRRAISTDNGVNFTFDKGNILKDSNAGGGSRSYVDTRSILIKGGCRRLFSMRGGTSVYSFTSSNYGFTFKRDKGIRVKLSSFNNSDMVGLFDPAVIRLPDRRYRMYVATQVRVNDELQSMIVSATTKRPRGRKETQCKPKG